MASPGDRALQDQMRADPRINAIVKQRRSGALTDAQLRAFGYDVPDGYHYTFGGRAGTGTLMDNKRSFAERAIPVLAIGAGAVGGLGAAGLIPGIGAAGGGAAALPASMTAVPPAIASQGVSAGIGGLTAVGGGGLAGLGGKALDWLKDPKNLLNLAPVVAALANRPGGGDNPGTGGADNAFLMKAYEDAQRVQDLRETRFRRVDPLHQAVTQLAFDRMPDSSRQGLNIEHLPFPPRRP